MSNREMRTSKRIYLYKCCAAYFNLTGDENMTPEKFIDKYDNQGILKMNLNLILKKIKIYV